MNKRVFWRAAAAYALVTMAPVAVLADDDDENPAIAYREAMMTLIGHNFGPMQMTLEGKIPWDDARMAGYGKELAALAGLNQMRGFPEGSDKGDTHAKPEIWKEQAKFKEGSEKMQAEVTKLAAAAKTGSLDNLKAAFGPAAQSCKACHDQYRKD